ncbi:hypothetical protein S40285_00313 [Stachybotrys chlorohalonatus IBT 40285]|uniref:Protein kinase domain-containing protein n=1 Tax=Stachybotrys chlorohalonatus (strain IBT 40285) TaxID=1283841 RepID=A0A084QHQ8_STAC4|nr:hypothetical protein S40285_00313 [Stachybotrys chlorohalonata IBT 40285]
MASPPRTPPEAVDTRPVISPSVTVEYHDDGPSAAQPPEPAPPRSPGFVSPLRQHKRTPSVVRTVKETLDARVEIYNDDPDGRTHHRINQYTIQEEIGRGSYGAVHLATDQYGFEYAVKEFSKTRLRKRAQTNILRQGPHRQPQPSSISSSLDPPTAWKKPQMGSLRARENSDALYLIREEIAIMKKLSHPNLVQLIEVLDDPEEDSLYMVLEMCKKGVVMKVGLGHQATPYNENDCRCLFRDLMLGIEYLHAQGVIHRDIKPDNLLLSEDNVLKIVDFGVSEMFEKPDDMKIAKSAGSPAFFPPELCGKHGEVSGRAVDIWSMGVSLFCLRYGKLPFNRDGMMQIYEAIKHDELQLPDDENPDLKDLLRRLLDKDPRSRIQMPELREHPWVTDGGSSPLLPKEENCSHMIEPPNELELNRAITPKMNHLLCVMKVIQRFKSRLANRSPTGSTAPAASAAPEEDKKAMVEQVEALMAQRRQMQSRRSGEATTPRTDRQDSVGHEPLILGIGTGAMDAFATDESTPGVVSDSPTGVDFDIYDRAYQDAIERHAKSNPSGRSKIYMTKFVKEKDYFKGIENLVDGSDALPAILQNPFKKPTDTQTDDQREPASGGKLAELTSRISIQGAGEHNLPKLL